MCFIYIGTLLVVRPYTYKAPIHLKKYNHFFGLVYFLCSVYIYMHHRWCTIIYYEHLMSWKTILFFCFYNVLFIYEHICSGVYFFLYLYVVVKIRVDSIFNVHTILVSCTNSCGKDSLFNLITSKPT